MVSFLHAADLHLGLRITRFDPPTTNRIREARLTALDKIRTTAVEQHVDFVLIAGDLFDDHAVDSLTASRAFEMLDDLPLPVYVLPGNHDPLISGGVWDRRPWSLPAPKRVRLLRQAEPVEVGSGVLLFPCPLFRKTSLHDPTSWIAEAAVESSAFRIGLAHGSLRVRDNLPADDHLISRHAAKELALDYLALGHWHSRRLFADPDGVERTAYPGVHEPMRFQGTGESRTGWVAYSGNRDEFLDSGKGEVLHVRLRHPGEAPEIQPIEVGHYLWQEETRELASEEDLSRLINDVATRPAVERRLLRLHLTGLLDATSMLRLEELREILTSRYLFGELDDTGLHVQPTEAEVRDVAGQGILRRILDQLQVESASADVAVPAVAARAILLLYQIAKEVQA